jgi:UDP-2,4-diacetamido-2,4,6-trideoxy-beta-L-altropyranose hydrolase
VRARGSSPGSSVLFRLDVGAGVGLGHFQRCLALANALQERGASPMFLCPPDDFVRARLAEAGIPLRELDAEPGGDADLHLLLETAKASRAAAIVIDSYRIDAGYLRAVRPARPLVVIDDLAEFPFSCELVVNAGILAPELPYRDAATRLLGPRFAMLRRELWEAAPVPVRPRARRVLVTVGGGDPGSVLPSLVRAVTRTENLEATIALGPFATPTADLLEAIDSADRRASLHEGATSLVPLQRETDIAVSAGGQTLYELLRLGVPTIALHTADNQAPAVERLAQEGIVCGGLAARTPDTYDELTDLLVRLAADRPARAAVAASGPRLVDGGGARRVAAEITGLLA